MKTIIVVGANPALQKVMHFQHLVLDQVNRSSRMLRTTGGKGTNFCRAARCHTGASAVLYTFLGGTNGARVAELLTAEGISFYPVPVPEETRECVTCLRAGSDAMTELIGPSHCVPPAAAAAMQAALHDALRPGTADGLAVMGSLPDGTDPGLYTAWARTALAQGQPLLIDTVKGIEPALMLPSPTPVILKINMEEFRSLTPAATDIADAFRYAMGRWTVQVIAVTNGPDNAYLQQRGQPLKIFTIPKLDNVVNPIGSGDTTAAVFFIEYLNGTDVVEAFRRGLVAASANCLQVDAGTFEKEDYDRLFDSVTVRDAVQEEQ